MRERVALTEDNDATDSYILETLHSAWDAYAGEDIGESAFLRTLDFVESIVNQQLQILREVAEEPEADPGEASILQGLQAHLHGLELMRRFFVEDDEELIEKGLVLIEDATELFPEGFEIAPEAFEQQYEDERSLSDPTQSETTDEFAAVADALEQWENGEITSAQFCRLLTPIRAMMEGDLQNLLDAENNDPAIEHLQGFLTGLDHLSSSVMNADYDGVKHSMSELAQATLNLLELEVSMLG